MLSEKIQLFIRVTIFKTSAMFLEICSTIGSNGFLKSTPLKGLTVGKACPSGHFSLKGDRSNGRMSDVKRYRLLCLWMQAQAFRIRPLSTHGLIF
jgi:hypothetical protein